MRDAVPARNPAPTRRAPRPAERAATRAMLRRAVPPARQLLPAILLGIGSAASSVALLACSAWLIARAAEQPPVLYLSLGIVGVRAFALGRAAFRYLERLTGHDASFRQLASIRAGIFERMLPMAPDALASSRRGDLLARFVDDVDELLGEDRDHDPHAEASGDREGRPGRQPGEAGDRGEEHDCRAREGLHDPQRHVLQLVDVAHEAGEEVAAARGCEAVGCDRQEPFEDAGADGGSPGTMPSER